MCVIQPCQSYLCVHATIIHLMTGSHIWLNTAQVHVGCLSCSLARVMQPLLCRHSSATQYVQYQL